MVGGTAAAAEDGDQQQKLYDQQQEYYNSITDDDVGNGRNNKNGMDMDHRNDNSNNNIETKLRVWGLTAGICYAIIIICGFCGELGIRSRYIDPTSQQVTVDNITDNPTLFRRGSIIFDLIMCCCDIIVCVLFGFMFLQARADPILSILNVVFRFLQQAVIAVNLLHVFAASILLENYNKATEYNDNDENNANNNDDKDENLAYFFLRLHKYGYSLALIFFGVSMVLLGVLVVWEGGVVFPRALGWLILVAGIGYIIDSTCYFMIQGYDGNDLFMIPAILAEFGLTIFLLFKTPKMKTL